MSMENANETVGENAEKLERLEAYLAQGFLLHGSKRRLETVEPRQATDTDPDRKSGKANAVYAEAHDVRIPILMALFDKLDPELPGWRSGYHAYGEGPIEVEGENYTFTKGFVHVLPRGSFEAEGDETDREYLSRVPVTPVDVIEVDASMIDHLGDAIARKESGPA